MYDYYVLLDSDNETVLDARSDAFITDTTGWTLIGEGESRHYYLQIRNEDNLPQYKWTGTDVVLKDAEEIYTEEINAQIAFQDKAEELKQMDEDFIRGIDDIITALHDNGILTKDKLPSPLIDKYNARAAKRAE